MLEKELIFKNDFEAHSAKTLNSQFERLSPTKPPSNTSESNITFMQIHHETIMAIFMEFFGSTILGYQILCAGSNDLHIQIAILCSVLVVVRSCGSHYHFCVTLILMFRPHSRYPFVRGILQIFAAYLGIFCGGLLCYYVTGIMAPPFLKSYEREWIIIDIIQESFCIFVFQFFNIWLFEPQTRPYKYYVNNIYLIVIVIYFVRKMAPHAGGNLNPTMTLAYFTVYYVVTGKNYFFSIDLLVHFVTPIIGSLLAYILFYCFIYGNDKYDISQKYK